MIQPDRVKPELKSKIDAARKKAAQRISADPAGVAGQAVSLLDLTTLKSTDTAEKIEALCEKAEKNPVGKVAAVCVYTQFVEQARDMLSPKIDVATVINFPDAIMTPVEVETQVTQAIARGVNEIDVVFPYAHFQKGFTLRPSEVLRSAKRAAGPRPMKVILESGKFDDPDQLYEASMLAIKQGANFLKTSTGFSEFGADMQAAAIMLQAIRDSGEDVGIKVSGYIKTAEQAAEYIALAEEIMGEGWVDKHHFRIGASGVLDSLVDLSKKPAAAVAQTAARPRNPAPRPGG